MKAFVRLFAAVLAAAMLLCGCGREMISLNPGNTAENETAKPVSQEEMPQEALKAAVKRLEYSAIAAAIAAEEERHFFENGFRDTITVHIGDIDGDQDEELVFGNMAFLMDSSEGKLFQFAISKGWGLESGYRYYTDCNGLFYFEDGKGDYYDYRRGYEYDPNNPDEWPPLPDYLDVAQNEYCFSFYGTWNGSEYIQQFVYGYVSLTEYVDYDNYSLADEPFFREEYVEFPSEEKLVDEAAVAYIEGLSLQAVDTTARDYTENSYDSKYQESICQALDGYLREGYSNYGGCLTGDVDDDGEEEQVFLLPGLLSPWEASIRQQENSDMLDWVCYEFDLNQSRTAVLLADRQGDRVVFKAGCVLGDYYGGSSARMDGIFLNVDGVSYPLGSLLSSAGYEELYPQLADYLNALGYREPVFLRADLSDMDGEDLICLCQKDGTWYVLILCIVDGYPVPLVQVDTSTTACYLTQADGKDCLLIYIQDMRENWDGGYTTTYGYRVLRFDARGCEQNADEQYVHISDDQQDATELSALMASLQKYLLKIIVVRDPYALTGQTWVQSSDTEYGTPPEEETGTQQEEGKLGFVRIQDPGSWLHLREGPGIEFDRILVDPADPDSFVRQALGSPVTVLETVETGDSENPVWVKIRIRYHDREFIGYSSKTYIRMQDEE